MTRNGFSLVEVTLLAALIGTLAVMTLPRLGQARARAAVRGARDAFTAAHSLAREAAARYGRMTRLHLEPDSGRFWVTADTSSRPDVVVVDTLQAVLSVGERFPGVHMQGRAQVFCFDPRGVATARAGCGLQNATVVFQAMGIADTLTISRLGRLRKR